MAPEASSGAADVSIILPAYRSEATIDRSLASLSRQTWPAREIIVVDSSGDDATSRIVRERHPEVRLLRSEVRLLPHAARNRGVAASSGGLLQFTDPDVYAPADWLETVVRARSELGGVIVSALACHGHRWIDVGAHLAKFDSWLPGGAVRRIPIGPTAGLLCSRGELDRVGGFDGSGMLGDTLLCWSFSGAGIPIWLIPGAVIEHHHTNTWHGLLRERLERGEEFGAVRGRQAGWSAARVVLHLAVTVLPLRLARLVGRTVASARRSGMTSDCLRVMPVVVSAHSAWLLGEARAYTRRLLGRGGRRG